MFIYLVVVFVAIFAVMRLLDRMTFVLLYREKVSMGESFTVKSKQTYLRLNFHGV